ncbi:Flagellar motility protein MotE, a chaperone for MotC folding [Salipaludibacillus aurantiacus]|uniref:Flagellar motility protein MotE, a chaperone for MotC folding n=2 Tax=Salipaludibacillus aurantiacus TaxID=1601833 RepID=A0A1H9QJH2_9BACI|nr:Flagellar motility protein MotE, a chaperone for MotC folding [Salipaludibacillus aurantiacus]
MKSGDAMSENKQTEKSQNKFQVFFMVIIIPAAFAVILAVVLLYYLGFNVGETFQKTAGFMPFIENEQEEELPEEEKLAQLEHENESYVQQIGQLESRLEEKEKEVADLEEELLTLQTDEIASQDIEEVTADLTDIVKTLEGMTASKAADIISELPQEEAVTYLRMMRVNNRAEVLSRVEPESAAQLLSQISN